MHKAASADWWQRKRRQGSKVPQPPAFALAHVAAVTTGSLLLIAYTRGLLDACLLEPPCLDGTLPQLRPCSVAWSDRTCCVPSSPQGAPSLLGLHI